MIKTILIAFAVLVLMTDIQNLAVGAMVVKNKKVDRYIARIVKRRKIPSISVAVVKGGEMVYSNAFGLADRTVTPAVPASPEHTKYLTASISKTVVAVTLLHLLENTNVNLDDDINKFLTKFKIVNPRYKNVPITFRHLLTHTSSISDTHYNKLDYEILYRRGVDHEMSLENFLFNYFHPKGTFFHRDRFGRSKPGGKLDYSNVASAVIAYLVEIISGEDFRTYSTKNILTPLGMNSTSWSLSSIDASKVAMPTIFKRGKFRPYCRYTFVDYPSGGVFATANDMAIFMNAIMNPDQQSVLSKETIDEMLTPQNLPGTKGEKQGLIFYYKRLRRVELVGHNGGEMGSSTGMFFNKQTKTGYVLLTNGDDDQYKYGAAIKAIESRLMQAFRVGNRRHLSEEAVESTAPDFVRKSPVAKSQAMRTLKRAAADQCPF